MNQDNLQQGVHLAFYCHVRARHDGMLVSQWLLEQARRDGLGGGSVFRATAGFGRHGVLREDQADLLLERVRAAGIDTVYARTPASYGVLGAAKAG
jgi:PII-like signaling protein